MSCVVSFVLLVYIYIYTWCVCVCIYIYVYTLGYVYGDIYICVYILYASRCERFVGQGSEIVFVAGLKKVLEHNCLYYYLTLLLLDWTIT